MEELKEMIETLNSNRRVDEETKELMRSLGFEIKKKFFVDTNTNSPRAKYAVSSAL